MEAELVRADGGSSAGSTCWREPCGASALQRVPLRFRLGDCSDGRVIAGGRIRISPVGQTARRLVWLRSQERRRPAIIWSELRHS